MFIDVKQINNKDKEIDAKLRALSSLNQDEYQYLFKVFSPLIEAKCAHFTLKGARRKRVCFKEHSNCSLPRSQSKFDFFLMFMKENSNQAHHACLFEMTQPKVSDWIRFISPVMDESLRKLEVMPQTGNKFKFDDKGEACLLIDVTESQVPRKVDYEAQKEDYSGKKKLHTMKSLSISEPTKGKILFQSPVYSGSVHDKAIWDDLEIEIGGINLLADLGFLGIEKEYENVIIPHKKPNGKELTEAQKMTNKGISKIRVRIEHSFAGVKRLKIIRNKMRLKLNDVRDRMMRIAVGLHNLRCEFR